MDRRSCSGWRDRPLVVKVGGSLAGSLPRIVNEILAVGGPILVVPGGGPFADRVREQDPDDTTAHWLAIGAMDRVGRMIRDAGLPAVKDLSVPAGPAVLLPSRVLREHDPLPHTWEVTSDTIAAWVARSLGAGLVLLKSVDGICCEGRLVSRLGGPCSTDVVDPCLIPFVLANGVPTTILNGRVPGRLAAFCAGAGPVGTRIDTRF